MLEVIGIASCVVDVAAWRCMCVMWCGSRARVVKTLAHCAPCCMFAWMRRRCVLWVDGGLVEGAVCRERNVLDLGCVFGESGCVVVFGRRR